MKITRRQLRQIIKEELYLEGMGSPGGNQHTYRVEFNELLPGNMELTHNPDLSG